MRVKIKDKICLCNEVLYNGTKYILFNTFKSGMLRVNTEDPEKAAKIYSDIYTTGYCDVSMFHYYN